MVDVVEFISWRQPENDLWEACFEIARRSSQTDPVGLQVGHW